jgi:hypothetical protein
MDCVLAGAEAHRARPLNSVVRDHEMHSETSPTADQRKSPILAAMAIVMAGIGAYAWVQSGQTAHLLGALAFAAMAPVWYLLPISFTESLQANWKRSVSNPSFPKWARVLTVIALVLLVSSVGLRWVA